MKKHILAVLDTSSAYESLRLISAKLASDWDATITGIGIIDPDRALESVAMPAGGMHFKVQTDLKKIADARKKTQSRLHLFSHGCFSDSQSCSFYQLEGDAIAIIRLESQTKDLILVEQNLNFLFKKTSGALNAMRDIVKDSSRPVYICPSKYIPGSEVIIPYDGSQPSARALHQFLVSGLHHKLPIQILTAYENYESSEVIAKRAYEMCKQYGRTVRVELLAATSRKPHEVIFEYVTKNMPELVVMGAFGHTGLKDWFFGSVTRTLLSSAKVPLFVVV